MLVIDGSFGSGGGSILRYATALSAITSKPITVKSIRSSRPKPGLAAQHLEGIRLAAKLCNAKLAGDHLGSTEISFIPGEIVSGDFEVSISTAGSIALLFQTVSLFAHSISNPVKVKVKGGATFGKFSPPLLYAKHVLLPALKRLGWSFDISIQKHGFFPMGGALAILTVHPCINPRGFDFERLQGETLGISVASTSLKNAHVANRQSDAAISKVHGANIRNEYVDSVCPGSGILIYNGFIGADSLGERQVRAQAVGLRAASAFLDAFNSGACVDSNLADQLIPFMALADKPSSFTCPQVTEHLRTNIWLTQKFLKTKFSIVKEQNSFRLTSNPES